MKYTFGSFKTFGHSVLSVIIFLAILKIALIGWRISTNAMSNIFGYDATTGSGGSNGIPTLPGSEVATNARYPLLTSVRRSIPEVVRRPVQFYSVR